MARARLKVRRLVNAAARRSASQHRATLIEQASQLSWWCSLASGKAVSVPGGGAPEKWPPVEVAADLAELFAKLPETDKTDHMRNLEQLALLVVDVTQKRERLRRARAENRKQEVKLVLATFFSGDRKNFDDLSPELREDVLKAVGARIEELNQRLEAIRGETTAAAPPAADAGEVDANATTAMDAPSTSGRPPA